MKTITERTRHLIRYAACKLYWLTIPERYDALPPVTYIFFDMLAYVLCIVNTFLKKHQVKLCFLFSVCSVQRVFEYSERRCSECKYNKQNCYYTENGKGNFRMSAPIAFWIEQVRFINIRWRGTNKENGYVQCIRRGGYRSVVGVKQYGDKK